MRPPTTWIAAALIGAALTLTGAAHLEAQGRGSGAADAWREADRRAGGPAFCRSGAGHPVHGRRWCVRKGFGLGGVGWRRLDLGEVIFRDLPRRNRGILDRSDLGALLGTAVLDRLLDEALGHHYRERHYRDRRRIPLTGRWLEASGTRVLQLRAGDRPLAELGDLDRDGVVEVLLRVARQR